MRIVRPILPSVTALAAFEAAARHLSFKRAAGELNVTPAAVSRQIGNLEAEVGKSLFRRLHRRVELTSEGEVLFGAVNLGFTGISRVIAGFRDEPTDKRVVVGSTTAMASFWLLPRLKRFWARYPEISVDHVISDTPIDMHADKVDVSIRFGQGAWPEIESRYLFADRIYPVCSPGHVSGRPELELESGLANGVLLDVHVADRWVDWKFWLAQQGLEYRPEAARHFNNYVIAVQAAVDGQGFALGWHCMVGGLVERGDLVRPFEASISSPGAFFLTYPAAMELAPEAVLFADWLQSEAGDIEAAEPSSGRAAGSLARQGTQG